MKKRHTSTEPADAEPAIDERADLMLRRAAINRPASSHTRVRSARQGRARLKAPRVRVLGLFLIEKQEAAVPSKSQLTLKPPQNWVFFLDLFCVFWYSRCSARQLALVRVWCGDVDYSNGAARGNTETKTCTGAQGCGRGADARGSSSGQADRPAAPGVCCDDRWTCARHLRRINRRVAI